MTRGPAAPSRLSMTSEEDGGTPRPSDRHLRAAAPAGRGDLPRRPARRGAGGRACTGRRRDGCWSSRRPRPGSPRPTRTGLALRTDRLAANSVRREPMPGLGGDPRRDPPPLRHRLTLHRGNALPRDARPGTSASERSPNPVTLARSRERGRVPVSESRILWANAGRMAPGRRRLGSATPTL
ncbi:hypothetical protein HBB16_17840 [Pseudonocardia sp. MCCB 268]|nr:hypothetical protein [Pseudonocardia cytotoxica]